MEMADRLRFVLLLLPVSLPVVCRLGLCWRRGVMTGIIVMCGAELYLRNGSHEEFRWKTFAYHRCVSPSVLSCPTVVYQCLDIQSWSFVFVQDENTPKGNEQLPVGNECVISLPPLHTQHSKKLISFTFLRKGVLRISQFLGVCVLREFLTRT